jgi:ATP-dependent helicase HepA
VEKLHACEDLVATILPANERVYIHDGSRWLFGRLDGVHPQDETQYLIALPNADGLVLHSDQFDVRWSQPLPDPFELLAGGGGDSPIVYEARLGLLRSWSRQRAFAAGVEGLLLGSVELQPHQLSAVRRASSDPVRRYLLADEVGLGKTIEAGALVWQFLATNPKGRVLVLAPDHLRQQWADELLERFRVDQFGGAWIGIRSHDDPDTWPESADLLVIDEAHHVTRSGDMAERIRRKVVDLAHRTEELLLLSATPVRSNEAGFLDLLHLLDPANYRPDELDDFIKRVEHRDQLALTYQMLTPDLEPFMVNLYASSLKELFPDDNRLAQLLDESVDGEESVPASIARVRQHLSETYRLHHRLIRTRRTAEIGQSFSVRGRTRGRPFTLEVPDSADKVRETLLNSVRDFIQTELEEHSVEAVEAVRAFRQIASRCGSLAHALVPGLAAIGGDDGWWPTALARVDDETAAYWRSLLDEIQASRNDQLRDLGEGISRMTVARNIKRTVIMSAFTETAMAVAGEMTRRWGPDRVACHLSTQSLVDNSQELARWLADSPCSILVCDAGAEEGINLQAADQLVHIDLPWESSRVEQRIGRCDRHSDRRLGEIPSTVVMYGSQSYAMGWFIFLADACQVFSRSVSSLQYVLNDVERDIHEEIFTKGSEVLVDAVETESARLEDERVRIAAHDALDSVDVVGGAERANLDLELIASDQESELTDALRTWLIGVGAGVKSSTAGVMKLDPKRRLQLPFEWQLTLAPFVETPFATDRVQAATRRIAPLRAGHGLVDGVVDRLWSTDRGVVFIYYRPFPGQPAPAPVLRADYLVSFEMPTDLSKILASSGLSTWFNQLLAEFAAPWVETVFVDLNGKEIDHRVTREPFDKRRGDRNLSSRPHHFEVLASNLDWTAICELGQTNCRRVLMARPEVTDRPKGALESIRQRLEQRIDREHARIAAGLPDHGAELLALLGTLPEVFSLQIQPIGCGIMVVADPSVWDSVYD